MPQDKYGKKTGFEKAAPPEEKPPEPPVEAKPQPVDEPTDAPPPAECDMVPPNGVCRKCGWVWGDPVKGIEPHVVMPSPTA